MINEGKIMTKKVVAWQYKNTVEASKVSQFELFAEMVDATFNQSYEDFVEQQTQTQIDIFFEEDDFFNKDAVQAELAKIADQTVELTPVYESDWQADCLNSFQPIEIGRFYIHSFDEEAPADKVSLKIPAKMAFGTGEHATTKGCLALYDKLATSGLAFKNGLDMGCGSAILAMGATKADNVKFLGVDIDLLSVDIANENLFENGVKENIEVIHGDGFNDPKVTRFGPYDIIFANILKNPLLDMAQDLVDTLDKDGYAILSGFKEIEQKDEIIAKYVDELGLTLVDEFNEDTWSALCLKK